MGGTQEIGEVPYCVLRCANMVGLSMDVCDDVRGTQMLWGFRESSESKIAGVPKILHSDLDHSPV